MRDQITATIQAVCKDLFGVDAGVELTRPDEQFGDYATNAALLLGKQQGKNPRELAEQLAQMLAEKLGSQVKSVKVAGPGFLNITISDTELIKAAKLSVKPPETYVGQVMVIETNNPNPFKDLHIGHAYNSIVADTVANLLEAGQAEVHRVSYHGDVGLHVGKSMWAILSDINNDPTRLEAIPAAERPGYLSKMYAAGAVAYEQDDLAKQQIEAYSRQSFVLDDPVFEAVYSMCKRWSFEYFDQTFARLGSQIIEKRYLERETDAAGRATVESHIGPVFEYSDGAVIFPAERHGLHTRVFINSRGNTVYEARDLGLMQLKEADFQPSSSYIVTANEQQEYFKVVFKAADLAMPELKSVTKNISTGMVKLSGGKMSSRKGTAINIGWLFDELEKAIRLRTKNEDSITDSVTGALRYTMLKVRIGSDVVFDIGDAISLEGNSGPYLQYAHARARSILEKVAEPAEYELDTLEPDERTLTRKIGEYAEVLERSVIELMPHHICNYLYELSQQFNRFYEHNRVVGDRREGVRGEIVRQYADVLKLGLTTLGIPAPDRL